MMGIKERMVSSSMSRLKTKGMTVEVPRGRGKCIHYFVYLPEKKWTERTPDKINQEKWRIERLG